MPLRRERQAYWDDIDAHVANVAPLSGTGHLARLCPEAAAARAALRSRLAAVEAELISAERSRARAASEAAVVRREDAAIADCEAKEAALMRAAAFVRGRLENDRSEGKRAHWGGDVHAAPRAGPRRAPRGADGSVVTPFSTPSPTAVRGKHRETHERWDSAEYSPIMGGGYTFVLQRAAREKEEAERRREMAERERELYFMEPREEEEEEHPPSDATSPPSSIHTPDRDGLEGGDGGVGEAESAGAALKGWGVSTSRPSRAGRRSPAPPRDPELESIASILPPPRAGQPGVSGNEQEPPSVAALSIDGPNAPVSEGGGYGSQLAILGVGGAMPRGGSRPSSRAAAANRGPRTPSRVF